MKLDSPLSPVHAGALLAALAAGQACVQPVMGPEPTAVEPAKGWRGAPQDVAILGQGFLPEVIAEARGGATVNRSYQASLLDQGVKVADLDRVSLVATDRLDARIPEGLPPGVYDLVVTGPTGEAGTLPGAYQVTDTRADRLALTAVDDRPFWTVNDTAVFDVQLLDPDDRPVHEQMPVRIELLSVDGAPLDAMWDTERDILLDQQVEPVMGGLSITGRLELDGHATIPLTVATPTDVLLRVEALDDDGVEPAVEDLSWQAGTDYVVQIDLPDEHPFEPVAGSTFPVRLTLLDEYGNVVDEPLVPVDGLLVDGCGDLFPVALPDFARSVEVDVTLRRATDTASCPDQRLQVALEGDLFASDPFEVRAGRVERFDVSVAGSEAMAGRPMVATVRPVDGFGNSATWDGDAGDLKLSDTIGDVDAVGCAPGDTFMLCTVTPTDAEPEVALRVRHPDTGLEGSSQPYRVVAAPLDHTLTRVSAADLSAGVVAGQAFDVIVELRDEFDNDVPADRFSEGDVTLTDVRRGDTACHWLGPAERGELAFTCTHYVAEEVELIATAPGGISSTTAPFTVQNAHLSQVRLTPSVSTVEAGDSFTLQIAGFDAWDNPYRVQSSPRVELSDISGSLSADHANLDGDGRASISLSVTRAGPTAILASRLGTDLGISAPVEVVAAEADRLSLVPTVPWAWVGTDLDVDLQALDAYGNAADLDGTARVSTADGTASAVSVVLVDGVGRAVLRPLGTSLSEVVEADAGGGVKGASDALLVVEDCGSSGPTAGLDFGGERDAVVCHDGTEATVRGDLGTSTGSPTRYALWVEGEPVTVDTSATVDVDVERVGTWDLKGLAIDADHCADEVSRTAWVGPDDGQPVGPIDLAVSDDRPDVGVDTTTLSLSGVQTCDGDPAVRGRVLLRTDRGAVTGVSRTGSGLQLTLDSSGDGSATLDLTGASMGGSGTVTAWVSSGAAAGSVAFRAIGDDRRPRVLEQDPQGYIEGDVDSIVLTFSEPLASSSLSTSSFSVTGPSAVFVDEVRASGSEVEIWLDRTVAAQDGRWTVEVDRGVSDVKGNGLDGAWTGASGDHTADFGKVSAVAPDVTGCTPSPVTVRPDGDDGRGSESDAVTLSATADRAVTTWVLEVRDGQGDRIWLDRIAGGSARSGSLVWKARDLTEKVVSDGVYTVVVTAENSDGTWGAACEASVRVDNRRGR